MIESFMNYATIAYVLFLLVIFGVNMLYFFQVFQYRLPGDASLPVLILHTILIATVLVVTGLFVSF